MNHTGMTLKQFAAAQFYAALEAYRDALASNSSEKIVAASLAVYCARRNDKDRAMINRVWNEPRTEKPEKE